ncbi:HalOD1 output domain-containing protein [Halobacterium sp. R2-5]|uniref:HalOD1 output domain-containing protein n=1 Tax=Halobacterium sp. R2-5 TaxID=2715751 RepID=UPI001AAF6D5E|nr:HalOD1 output domain-containing protein [Halobacterium sp. R2-5]
MTSTNAAVESHQSVDTSEYRYEVAPDESPSEAVITAVAEATGRPATPLETDDSGPGSDPLPPLFETINPDALDALAAPQDGQGNCLVTFTYAGCTVSVEEQAVTVATQT